MSFDSKLAARIKSRCGRMLDRAIADIQNIIDQKNWKALSRVIKGACRNALQLAMIELRETGETDAALEYFIKARELSKSLTLIPKGKMTASTIDIPIYCCLLSGDIDSARKLSAIILEGNTDVVPGSYFDVHARILSATVLGDADTFEKTILEFLNLDYNYWWEKQKVYFELYRSVIENDEVVFNELLSKALDLFQERRTDKEFGNQLGEYGGLEYNQFAIDFMSVGLAILAKSKGLSTQLNNAYFPSKLVSC